MAARTDFIDELTEVLAAAQKHKGTHLALLEKFLRSVFKTWYRQDSQTILKVLNVTGCYCSCCFCC